MNSLRTKLLVWLLGAVLLAGVAQAIALYRITLNETATLFDYHLQQQALSLRDQVLQESFAGVPADEREYDFVVQIWSMDGQRLYLSRPGGGLPGQVVLGFSNVHSTDGEWRVFSIQLRDRLIQVGQPVAVRSQMALATALRTLSPLLLILPLLAGAVWLSIGRVLRPIDNIAGAVERRHVNSLEPLAEDGLPTEIAPLAGALNRLLDRLSKSIATQQTFIGDAAHELRSPLTALRLQAQLLARAGDEQTKTAAAETLIAGIDRTTRLVEQLLALARSEHEAIAVAITAVRIDDLARECVAQHAEIAESKHIDLGAHEMKPLTVVGDADSLRILLRNLVDNALRHTPAGGRIDVGATLANGRTAITVADSGPGIPEAERARVLDRFYRRAGQEVPGSGLGLAIVKSIAQRHAAEVRLSETSGGGLTVSIIFNPSSGAPHNRSS